MFNTSARSAYRPTARLLAAPLAAGLVLSISAALPPAAASGETTSWVPSATSWIANSGHGGGYSDPASRWVQHDAEGGAVDSDGTAYVSTLWDEGTSEVGVYRDGVIVGRMADTHGWNRLGGTAVAVDAQYAYAAMTQGPQSGIDSPTTGTWYGFRRFDKATRSGAGLPANGHSREGSMRVVSLSAPVTGLAASSSEVFAAVAGEGVVRVYAKSDYREVRSFAVPSVTKLAVERDGDLWAVSAGAVVELSPTGVRKRTLSVIAPTSVAFAPDGRLLVTSDGTRQQVVILDVSAEPREVDAVGVPGGMFSAPRGAVGPLRLNGPVAAGISSSGAMTVVEGLGGDGTVLRGAQRTAAGWTESWRLHGLAFVDNADIDPLDENVAHTSRDRFRLDLTRPAGQQWVWEAHTVDRLAYPSDPRNRDTHQYVSPDAVVVGGKRFLFQTGMYQDSPRFYRLEGDVAVPSTSFPTFHGWGWQVDASGDVWNVDDVHGLYYHRFTGLDAAGNPTFAPVVNLPVPAGMSHLTRVNYDVATDVMHLAGWTSAVPKPVASDTEKLVGGEVWQIRGWKAGNRTPAWRTVLPCSRPTSGLHGIQCQIGLSFAGDRFFTVEMGTSRVRAYNSVDGSLISTWLPGSEVGGYVGVVDIPDSIKASQRADGRYVVFVEEDHAAKVLMYVLPSTGVTASAPSPTPTSTATASPTPTPTPTSTATASPTPTPTTVSPSPTTDGRKIRPAKSRSLWK